MNNRLGYNTNGLAHHAPADALALLAEEGYAAVGLTVDHTLLNPWAADFHHQVEVIGSLLERYQLSNVIETGARFLLDPRRKHEPTLVSPSAEGRARRIEFYHRCIDLARWLESDCVSLWSGIAHDDAPSAVVMDRLVEGLSQVGAYAEREGVRIGFEPEPGMFIDTLESYAQLRRRVEGAWLGLTLDIGHLQCEGELPLAEKIRSVGDQLVNVHVEDMRRGVHEHLQFGEGEIDFAPVMQALADSPYRGGVYVELSRHSHLAPTAVRQAREFLRPWFPDEKSRG